MNKNYEISISLSLQAPFMTQATGTMEYGLDTSIQRYNDKPVINGSLIRGVLRETLTEFTKYISAEKKDKLEQSILDWFGSDPKDSSYIPRRARLGFDYFWALSSDTNPDESSVCYRIGIDDNTGVVRRGNLQVIESPFKPGEEVKFEGCVFIENCSEEEIDYFFYWLEKATEFIASIGSFKGIGFGRVTSFRPEKNEARKINFGDMFKGKSISLALTLDRPFCIAKPHRPNSNLFESYDHIPGNVIKGALARTIDKKYPALIENLDKIIISHAYAEAEGTRSLPLPLSIAVASNLVIDASSQEDAFVFSEKTADTVNFTAPVFSPDWKSKHWNKVATYLKDKDWNLSPELKRQLSVHTAIESSRGSAEEGQLFSLDSTDPESTLFIFRIGLDKVDKNSHRKIIKELKQVFSYPISGIGKTKARAICSAIKLAPHKFNKKADTYHLILTSPARMFSQEDLTLGTNSQDQVRKAYQKYFDDVSNNSFRLVTYFAQQQLYGGDYYWHRFRKNKTPYQPEYLTREGSVFVLRPIAECENEAFKLLSKWQQEGLPQPMDRENDGWETNPFVAENGFGEIIINHDLHQQPDLIDDQELKYA